MRHRLLVLSAVAFGCGLAVLFGLVVPLAWRAARPVCQLSASDLADLCSDRGAEVAELIEADGCRMPEVECND